MAPNQHHSPDDPISRDLVDALRKERDLRPEAKKRAFTAQVLREIAINTPSTALASKSFTFWKSKGLLAGMAAILILGFLGIVGILSGRFNHEQRSYRMRLKAEKITILNQPGSLQIPELFSKEEGKNLVFLIYDYHGERCLWLYPERYVKKSNSDTDDSAWQSKEKWIQRVNQGSVDLPEAALTQSFPPGEPLVLMKIGYHFEIWTQAGLERYFAKADQET